MRQLHACLFVPDFAVAVLLRGEWNRCIPPMAAYTGARPNCFVYAANEPARQGGVREGMPLAEAVARFGLAQNSRNGPVKNSSSLNGSGCSGANRPRLPLRDEVKGKGIKPYRLRPTTPVATGAAACPSPQSGEATPALLPASCSLQIRPRDPEAEQQTQQELLDLALTISPRVEDAAPGLLILDLAGIPDPHHSAQQLSHSAEKLGLPVNVGVSANRFVAISAARTQTGVTHIFPGQEAGFLSVLPLDTLPLDPQEQETFARWGLRTIGDLARLPEDSLVARFGTRGAQFSQLARGSQEAVMRPFEPPPALEEKFDLDWQIVELDPLTFLLSSLLERLCLKLQGHNLAAAEIRVALKLADGSRHERAVAMSHPLADPRTLLALLRLDLAAHPPGDAIEGVIVAAQPSPRRLTQFSLFDPALPSPEKLAVTLARLTNLVGPGHVGAPVVPDTHRPGAFAVEVFVPEEAGRGRRRRGGRERRREETKRPEEGESRGGSRQVALRVATGAPAPAPHSGGVLTAPLKLLGPSIPKQELTIQKSSESNEQAETRSNEPAPQPSPGGVLVFPVAEQDQLQADAAAGISLSSHPLDLEAKVVVFHSPFHGEEQAGAPVATQGVECYAPTSQRINRSTDQPINGFTSQRLNGPTAQRFNDSTTSSRQPHAFRCFRPSPEAEVLLRGDLPVYVDSFEVRGPVRTRAGPWRVCGEWWATEAWQYEEWDVEVNNRLYRICCELPTRRWYVTGAYD